MVSWERLRTDFRAFGRLAGYSIPIGHPSAFCRRLTGPGRNIPAVVSYDMIALSLCWRVACWPRSHNAIVGPRELTSDIVRRGRSLMGLADYSLRNRILFLADDTGLCCDGSDIIGAAHSDSGAMGIDYPAGMIPMSFTMPNASLIPGCHLKYIVRLMSRPETTVVTNFPPAG